MRKKKKKNIYRMFQHWDYRSELTYITYVSHKKVKYVSHELDHIFGLIGNPTTFKADNGKEFVAKLILKLLKDSNPNIFTVTG